MAKASVSVGERVWVAFPGDRFSGKVVAVGKGSVTVDDGVGTEWQVRENSNGGMWLESGSGEVIYGNAKQGAGAWKEKREESERIRPDYAE